MNANASSRIRSDFEILGILNMPEILQHQIGTFSENQGHKKDTYGICRSREQLSNAYNRYLIVKIGVDTAENELIAV